MKIKQRAKNGQVVVAIKTYDELTDEERTALIFPCTDDKTYYDDYRIRRNKKGELIAVDPRNVSAKWEERLKREDSRPDLVDACQVLYNKHKHSRAYQSAKKRLNVSNEQINVARRIVNRKS